MTKLAKAVAGTVLPMFPRRRRHTGMLEGAFIAWREACFLESLIQNLKLGVECRCGH